MKSSDVYKYSTGKVVGGLMYLLKLPPVGHGIKYIVTQIQQLFLMYEDCQVKDIC